MKKYRAVLFVVMSILLLAANYKKDKAQDSRNELEKLPPITQNGANTFGCLINGKLYIPKGFEQNCPNFNMIVDSGFNDESFGVLTYGKADNLRVNISFGSDSIKTTGFYVCGLRTSFVYR